MTFVGKILVVMHLLLSVLFMAFAGAVYTAQNNWRTETEAQKKQVAKIKSDLQTLQTTTEQEKTDAATKMAAFEGQVAELTGLRNNLQLDSTRLLAENKELRTAYDVEREAARLNSLEADERVQEAVLQREKNQVLYGSRNELVTKLQQLEDKLFEQDIQRADGETKNKQLVRDVAAMRSYLISKGLNADPRQLVAQSAPPPPVRGLVMDARKSQSGSGELIEISLGSDDGLAVGHSLTVFREGNYLGQIRLVYVTPDRAVGNVVTRVKNTTIQKGDNVTTQL